jgi:vacuolar-type H+-ATPase subunit H
MSDAPNPSPPAGESIEALRRLKATEDELEAQATSAGASGAERLKTARAEADEAFRLAKAEAERNATASIEAARAGLDREVASIVKAGAAEAAKVASGSKVAVAALKPKLIDAVVGSFRSD